jgi:hypothetical protein
MTPEQEKRLEEIRRSICEDWRECGTECRTAGELLETVDSLRATLVTKAQVHDALIRSLGLDPNRLDIKKFWSLLGGAP